MVKLNKQITVYDVQSENASLKAKGTLSVVEGNKISDMNLQFIGVESESNLEDGRFYYKEDGQSSRMEFSFRDETKKMEIMAMAQTVVEEAKTELKVKANTVPAV